MYSSGDMYVFARRVCSVCIYADVCLLVNMYVFVNICKTCMFVYRTVSVCVVCENLFVCV